MNNLVCIHTQNVVKFSSVNMVVMTMLVVAFINVLVHYIDKAISLLLQREYKSERERERIFPSVLVKLAKI